MKKHHAINLLSSLTVAAVLALMAGCATKGTYQQGTATGAGLMAAADKIDLGSTNVDWTLASLNDLVNNPSGDLVPKFKVFNDSVTKLQSSYQNLQDATMDARQKGNDYMTAWDAQLATIMNPDIKNASQQRKAAVQAELNDTKRSYAQVRVAFDPFMANLKDIQTALGTDLTAGGITAVKSAADQANNNGAKLKDALANLSKEFRDVGIAMGSSLPTNQMNQATPPSQ
jgi:hypothetical protein